MNKTSMIDLFEKIIVEIEENDPNRAYMEIIFKDGAAFFDLEFVKIKGIWESNAECYPTHINSGKGNIRFFPVNEDYIKVYSFEYKVEKGKIKIIQIEKEKQKYLAQYTELFTDGCFLQIDRDGRSLTYDSIGNDAETWHNGQSVCFDKYGIYVDKEE